MFFPVSYSFFFFFLFVCLSSCSFAPAQQGKEKNRFISVLSFWRKKSGYRKLFLFVCSFSLIVWLFRKPLSKATVLRLLKVPSCFRGFCFHLFFFKRISYGVVAFLFLFFLIQFQKQLLSNLLANRNLLPLLRSWLAVHRWLLEALLFLWWPELLQMLITRPLLWPWCPESLLAVELFTPSGILPWMPQGF